LHRARTAYIPEVPKRNAIVLVVICLSCLAAYAASQQGAAGRRLGEVLSLVRSSYFEPVDEDRLVESALDAAIAPTSGATAASTWKQRSTRSSAESAWS